MFFLNYFHVDIATRVFQCFHCLSPEALMSIVGLSCPCDAFLLGAPPLLSLLLPLSPLVFLPVGPCCFLVVGLSLADTL